MTVDSGVDVTAPPFSLRHTDSRVLLEQEFPGSVSRVVLYRLG